MAIRRPILKKLSRQAAGILTAMGLLVVNATAANATGSTGNVDTTWAASGVFNASVFNPDQTQGAAVVALAGGKTLHLVRQLQSMGSSQGTGYGLFQLTSSGELDSAFSADGWLKAGLTLGGVTYSDIYVNSLNVLSDGSILVAGSVMKSDNTHGLFATKYDSSGALVTGFGTNGITVVAPDNTGIGRPAISIATSGKIYAWFTTNGNRIIRLNANGSPDSTFNQSGQDFLEGPEADSFLGVNPSGFISIGAFTVDESTATPTAIAVGVHTVYDGSANSSAIAYKVKFDKPAIVDTSYTGTSNFPSSGSAATNGFVRVDLGVPNITLRAAAISSDGFAYVVGGTFNQTYAAAIDLTLKKRHDAFGTSGVANLTTRIPNTSNIRVSGTGATRSVLVVGSNSASRPIVVRYVNDVLAASFGTSGVATLSTCSMTDVGDIAETTASDGGIVILGNVNSLGAGATPQTPRVIRLGAGATTNTCGASSGGGGGGGGGNAPSLPTLTGTVEEVAGPGIKLTVPAVASGARLSLVVIPSTFTVSPSNADNPVDRLGDVDAKSVETASIGWADSQYNFTRSTRLEVGATYTVKYTQVIFSPYAVSAETTTTITITGKVTAPVVTTATTIAPATTVAPAATPTAVPGVTVTDTKVYTAAAPKKVAAGSAIAVMTQAQAKTRDIETLTPMVCVPANDDLVFIKTGRCVAQVVNEKTGKVLRTLSTRVVADEVSELNVGNEIVTLAPIYFGGASASVDAKAIKVLQSIKDRISAAGTVLIVGHSGILMGNTPENQEMSRARAIATRKELQRMGAKGPFYITPAGALAPATTKMTSAAQAKNRRVVIVLIP
jgi:outer membrane protein OmpA-like peptidoglycan-associated protein